MSDCNVCLGSDPEEFADFWNVTNPKARKEHRCEECNRPIAIGQKYQRTAMKFDGAMDCYKTCLDCETLRSAFSCDGVICIGELWGQINEVLFPDMTTGCLEKVSSASAKAYLVKRWNDWKFGQVRP